jgi:hypothetical protein
VIIVRRLNEHTASVLERMLFSKSAELREMFRAQAMHDIPAPTNVKLLAKFEQACSH